MITFLLLCLSFPYQAEASPATYKIDPVHSSITFRIRHLVSRVSGRFTKFSGIIVIDTENVKASAVEAEIDVRSISTDNEKRDAHLRKDDFFAVDSYPVMTYRSIAAVPGDKNKAVVKGGLKMHGVMRPVELKVELLGQGADPWGGYRAGFVATATFDRRDFGMTYGFPAVGWEVTIEMNIEAVLQPEEKPTR